MGNVHVFFCILDAKSFCYMLVLVSLLNIVLQVQSLLFFKAKYIFISIYQFLKACLDSINKDLRPSKKVSLQLHKQDFLHG